VLSVADRDGNLLEENRPEPHEAIRADTAFVMTNLLRGVVQRGTAAAAASLDWPLAGKTGTMDEYTDAWFIGFDPNVTVGVWLGRDEKKPIGPNETGSQAALPIWMGYAAKVLKGVPESELAQPAGVVTVNINPNTGLREPSGVSKTTEYFYAESQPPVGDDTSFARDQGRPPDEVRNQIF